MCAGYRYNKKKLCQYNNIDLRYEDILVPFELGLRKIVVLLLGKSAI